MYCPSISGLYPSPTCTLASVAKNKEGVDTQQEILGINSNYLQSSNLLNVGGIVPIITMGTTDGLATEIETLSTSVEIHTILTGQVMILPSFDLLLDPVIESQVPTQISFSAQIQSFPAIQTGQTSWECNQNMYTADLDLQKFQYDIQQGTFRNDYHKYFNRVSRGNAVANCELTNYFLGIALEPSTSVYINQFVSNEIRTVNTQMRISIVTYLDQTFLTQVFTYQIWAEIPGYTAPNQQYFSVSGDQPTIAKVVYITECDSTDFTPHPVSDFGCTDVNNCVINLDGVVMPQKLEFNVLLPNSANNCEITQYRQGHKYLQTYSIYQSPGSELPIINNGKVKIQFDTPDDDAFLIWGKIPDSVPEAWVPVFGINIISVHFVLAPTCSNAIISSNIAKKEWILAADPDKQFEIDWKYFMIGLGQNDASYSALSANDKLPTFSSSLPNCEVLTIQIFENNAATQTYSKAEPVQTIIIRSSPPSLKLVLNLTPNFKQSFFVKASNSDGNSAVVELAITICGAEKITSSKMKFQFDQYGQTNGQYITIISLKSLIEVVSIDFSKSKANTQCTLVDEKTKVWIDEQCTSQQLDGFYDPRIVTKVDGNSEGSIQIDTSTYFYEQMYYVSYVTRGLVSECIPITFSVEKKCLPISFKQYSDVEITFVFDFKTGLKAIGLEKQLDLNKTDGCPITSYSLSQVEAPQALSNHSYKDEELLDLDSNISSIVQLNGATLVVDTDQIMQFGTQTLIVGASQEEVNFAYTKVILLFQKLEKGESEKKNEGKILGSKTVISQNIVTTYEEPIKDISEQQNDEDAEEKEILKTIKKNGQEESQQILLDEIQTIFSVTNGETTISEQRPQWFINSRASPKEVQKLLYRRSESYWDDQKDYPIQEPLVKISRITRDQVIQLEFNQEFVIPKFRKQKSRLLYSINQGISLDQIDITRDILDIKFILKSDINPKQINYIVTLIDWNEKGLKIAFNTSNPLLISQGDYRDSFEIIIKNNKWFQSAITGKLLKLENGVLLSNFPIQLPKGQIEQIIIDEAKAASSSIGSLFFIKISLSIFLKSSLDDIWILFLTLQIVAYLNIYDAKIPAGVSIYVVEFRNIVSFQALKPDFLLEMILGPVDKSDVIKKLTGSLEDSSQSTDIVKNLIAYITIFVVFTVFFLVILICSNLSIIKREAKKLKEKIIKQTFFNNIIRSVTLSYIETAVQIKVLLQTNPESQTILGIYSFLISYIVIVILVLVGFRDKLHLERVKSICGRLYPNIKLNKEYLTVLYYPIFMLRRLLFVCIVITFQSNGGLQLAILAFLNSLYVLWYGGIQPHNMRALVVVELANEIIFMCFIYHLFTFTKFIPNLMMHQTLGHSYIYFIGLLVACNFSYILYNQFLRFLSKKRRDMIKKLQAQRLQILKEVMTTKKLINWKIDINNKIKSGSTNGSSYEYSKKNSNKQKVRFNIQVEKLDSIPNKDTNNRQIQPLQFKKKTLGRFRRRNKKTPQGIFSEKIAAEPSQVFFSPRLETIKEDGEFEEMTIIENNLECVQPNGIFEPDPEDIESKIAIIRSSIDQIFNEYDGIGEEKKN